MSDSPRVLSAAEGDATVLRPVGDFDVDGADLLRHAFTEAQRKVVVDLSATTFLDSVALGTIIGGAKRADGSGGWLRLVAPTKYVRRVLEVTGIEKAFGLYDSVEQAITAD